MKKWTAILFALLVSAAWSQPSNPSIIAVGTAPSGSCAAGLPNRQVVSSGVQYSCQGVVAGIGTWGVITGSGTFTALTGDATSTSTGGATTVIGLGGIHFTNTPSPSLSDVICYDGVQYTPCPPTAGPSQILYTNNTASDISTYDIWDTVPFATPFTIATSIPNTATKTLMESFATASGYPDITVIPAGEWQSDAYVQVSAGGGTTTLNIDVYNRTSGGVETLLFSFANSTVSGNGTAVQHYTQDAVESAFAVASTDRLVVKYSMTRTGSAAITGTLYGGGSTNYSHIHTPMGSGINELLPGWTVTGSGSSQVVTAPGTVAASAAVFGQAGVVPQRPTTVLFGDSITYRNGSPAIFQYSGVGYFIWANALLGQPFNFLYNAGVVSNTTGQMLARVDSDVISYHPAWCFVLGGINDIGAGIAEAVIESNLAAIYAKLNAAGIRVVALTIGPSNTVLNNPTKIQTWTDVNNWMREYARSANNFMLSDTAASYIDPLNTNPVPLDNTTDDGLHPSTIGAYLMGKTIAASLSSVAQSVPSLPTWNGDSGLLSNSLMTGSATDSLFGSATGVAATGWTLNGTGASSCVGSKAARSDGFGEWQQMAVSGRPCLYYQTLTGWSVGDTIYAEAELSTSAINTYGIQFELLMNGQYEWTAIDSLDGSVFGQTISGAVFRTPNVTIPNGSTSIIARFILSDGTVKIGRVVARKVQ